MKGQAAVAQCENLRFQVSFRFCEKQALNFSYRKICPNQNSVPEKLPINNFLTFAETDFTQYLSGSKILKFPLCAYFYSLLLPGSAYFLNVSSSPTIKNVGNSNIEKEWHFAQFCRDFAKLASTSSFLLYAPISLAKAAFDCYGSLEYSFHRQSFSCHTM